MDPYSSDGHDGIVREDGKTLYSIHPSLKEKPFIAELHRTNYVSLLHTHAKPNSEYTNQPNQIESVSWFKFLSVYSVFKSNEIQIQSTAKDKTSHMSIYA